jgi:hypothetical protein
MSDLQLTLEEKQYLVALLQQKLKETEIEEHRTDALRYKQGLARDEELIKVVLAKLGAPQR